MQEKIYLTIYKQKLDIFLNYCVYILYKGGITIKKENCPFCGHRWIRSSEESPIKCPNCGSKYYSQEELAKRQEE
ncbi:hypothetical protein AYK20_06880 [Thermoplasmatales archaeon SG8-52-1]|nr:MAG: hypothetical protein AYK20_06880 [Thermoplasmatales archaeon SG8-52-1]